MLDNRQHMEWIDRYLTGQLTGSELDEFERLQRENGAFRELVHDMKLLAGGIRLSARDSLRAEMQEWEKNLSRKANFHALPGAARILRTGWIPMAAAACIMVVLYLGIFRPAYDDRLANGLYREYFDGAYPNVVDLTYRHDPAGTKRDEAYMAYDREDYREAAAIWSAIPVPGDTVLFYLGQSYLESGEYEKAAGCFKKVLKSRIFLPDQAQWFLALALLRNHQTVEALEVLREIAAGGGDSQVKAGEIIEKLTRVH